MLSNKRFSRTLSISVAVLMLFTMTISSAAMIDVYAQDTETICSEMRGSNSGEQDYSTYASPVRSYLVDTGNGYMTVQDNDHDESISVAYYDSAFNVTKVRSVDLELPFFGAFYSDGNNYFIVTGAANLKENNDQEVIRLTKYDLNWNRIGSCGVYGANTTMPFDAGSCRIISNGKYLAIRTCHEMYKTSDGLNHQATLTIVADTEAMETVQTQYSISYYGQGYVSHSFNQFIVMGNGEIATLDHGDAGDTRAFAVLRYDSDLSDGRFVYNVFDLLNVMNFPGESGQNETGASVGGFESTENGYLIAGNSKYQHADSIDSTASRDVFVAAVNTSGSDSSYELKWLSDVGRHLEASTPQLVKIDSDRFMVLWTEKEQIKYTLVNGEGESLSQVYSANGDLSDCKPIVSNGKIIWYTWGDSEEVFYSIPLSNISKIVSKSVTVGHDWEITGVSSDTVNLKCKKCGKTGTDLRPDQLYIGYSCDGNNFKYGYAEGNADLSDTVLIRCQYINENGDWVKFDEFDIAPIDSDKVSINKLNHTLTFKEEGDYTVTAYFRYDRTVSASMVIHVEDSAHIWELTGASNGKATYKCSHCGKTKTESYPTDIKLGYSSDGYGFSLGQTETSTETGGRLYFSSFYEKDGFYESIDDILLETSDSENTVIDPSNNSVLFSKEGVYTITGRLKIDNTVAAQITVYAYASDHHWVLDNASDGVATFRCTDPGCDMIKTETYPMFLNVGYSDGTGCSPGSINYNQGWIFVNVKDTLQMGVYGLDNDKYTLEAKEHMYFEGSDPSNVIIDNDTKQISFKEAGYYTIEAHHIYDYESYGYILVSVLKSLESVELTATPEQNCAVGSDVTIDANENGGFGNEVFTYWLTDPDGHEKEIYKAHMSEDESRRFTWTPEKTGTYRIRVSVYDTDEPDIVVSDEMTYVVSAAVHTPMPAREYNVPRATDHVTNDLLAATPGWEFDPDELLINGDLEIGVPKTFTIRYVLDDKDNYDFNEMQVTVTRSDCDHARQERRGAVTPTCVDEGWTGDLVCIDCETVLENSTSLGFDPSNHANPVTTPGVKAGYGSYGYTDSIECNACGAVIKECVEIPAIYFVEIDYPEKAVYNGKAFKPAVTVYDFEDNVLRNGTDYTVRYTDNVKPGYATVNVSFKGDYEGDYDDWFYIEKASNKLKVTPKTATIRYSKLKKKSQTIKASKAFTASKGNGTLTYSISKVSKSRFKKYFSINKKTGNITVKKGLKKGTYKVTISVKASGTTYYKSATKKVTTKIVVK